MNKIDVVNLIAAVLSIISVIASFIILVKNKTIRNEIINRQELKDYTEFVAKSRTIIDNIRKFTTIKKKINVLSLEKLIEHLRSYYELIKDIEYKLLKNGMNTIKNDIEKLEHDIQFYSGNDNRIFTENTDKLNKTYFNIIKIQKSINEIISNKIY
jgi:hypothetical protein